MPWEEVTVMSQRLEFVMLASVDEANMSRLCERYGISRKTGYKWLRRFQEGGESALADCSRRPHASPGRTAQAIEEAILGVRKAHPTWGARKIRVCLKNAGFSDLPAPSTITAILQRQGCIEPAESRKHRPWQRFVASLPNELWQMDFKGHFPLLQGRCHPLTVLDDHSRFALCLQACGDETGATVQTHLTPVFRRYGLPKRLLVDNGPPWGATDQSPYTTLTVWFLRLGIEVTHSGRYHPQTLGKDERFHRTLKAELLGSALWRDLVDSQDHFDPWREVYNCQRPHEALDMAVPAQRYRESPREFPESLPPLVYGPGDIVRKVQGRGEISFHNRLFKVGSAFHGYPVALRPTLTDGLWQVYFCQHEVAQIDLRQHNGDL